MKITKILILQTGSAIKSVKESCGDFNELFVQGFKSSPISTDIVVIPVKTGIQRSGNSLDSRLHEDGSIVMNANNSDDASLRWHGKSFHHDNQKSSFQTWPVFREDFQFDLNDLHNFDAICITGSPAMIGDNPPWLKKLERIVKKLVELKKPLLGVCFGHQFLAHLFGGTVTPHPQGPFEGVQDIHILHSHPLFEGLGNTFKAYVSHRDFVSKVPSTFKILAQTNFYDSAAFEINPQTFSVQFHPEWTQNVSRLYLKHENFSQEQIDTIPVCTSGSMIFQNFLKSF